MDSAEALIYFFEDEAVIGVLPDWPAEMQIAVCLRPDGTCHLAIHHQSEVTRTLGRFAGLYGSGQQELYVAPQVDGYRTRKVKFSEAQQLLTIVAERPDLSEIATDYAINFRFAFDEGLASDPVTGMMKASRSSASLSKRVGACVASEKSETVASANWTELYLGDQSLAAPSTATDGPESLWLNARLHPDDGTLQLIIDPQEPADPYSDFETRPDSDQLVIPHAQLGSWSLGETATFALPAQLLSEKPAFRILQHPHHCQVRVTAQAVVVSLGVCVQSEDKGLGTVTPSIRTRKRRVGPLRAALAVLVGAMLVSGHFATALDNGSQHTEPAEPIDSGTTAALKVIATMARAEVK